MTKEKKIMLVALIIIIVIAIVIGVVFAINNVNKNEGNNANGSNQEEMVEEFAKKLEDGSRVNVSETLLKPKTLDGLEITNIQLKELKGETTLTADVENKTKNKSNSKRVKIEILDKAGNTMMNLIGVIDGMQPGGKVKLNVSVTADVVNAYDFKISNEK